MTASTNRENGATPGRTRTGLLHRLGGYLVRPRAHAATLGPDEGRWDAALVFVLYAVGTSIDPLAHALANVLAVRNWSGVLMFLSAVVQALIAPIVVLVASEWLLGSARAYQRAAGLLPLTVVATLGHAASQYGWALPAGPHMPAVVGGALGIALVVWIRGAVPGHEEAGA